MDLIKELSDFEKHKIFKAVKLLYMIIGVDTYHYTFVKSRELTSPRGKYNVNYSLG